MWSKKGYTIQDAFQWLWYGILVLTFIFVLRYSINYAVEGFADTHHLEHYVLYDRMVRSKGSIFYYDKDIDRVYPGIVNKGLFYEDTLLNLFGKNDDFGVKINGTQANYEIFYNKEIYNLGHPIYDVSNPLYGGIEHSFPVVVNDNDVLLIGLMYKKW